MFVSSVRLKYSNQLLEQFKHIWALQEQEKATSIKKVKKLLEDVRELEKGSWDREGAVEQ